jgi:transcriptional regulator with XRE-family HTH domain
VAIAKSGLRQVGCLRLGASLTLPEAFAARRLPGGLDEEVALLPDNLGPMASRRQLGEALRRYRLAADKSVGQAAECLECHPSKITRIEKAQRAVSARDVRDLAAFYGIEDEGLRDRLMKLARDGREPAWWQNFDLAPVFQKFFGLEGSASEIRDYQLAVPGLLQTRDYANAVVRVWTDDPVAVKEAVDVRMLRQEYLRKDIRLRFVVDEVALHRVVGGADVMRNQVDHLIRMALTPQVEFQVVPFARGAHRGMIGGFTVLQFEGSAAGMAGSSVPDVVHIEGLGFNEATYLDRPEQVNEFLQAFETLRELALTAEETISFLRSVRF